MELLDIRDHVRPMMKESRYLHTLGTEEVAYDLALIHGCDVYKARLTALLHDCAKNPNGDVILEECVRYDLSITETERQRTELLHAKLGVIYARERFGIEDEEILNAIRYHTTGRPGMSLLEKIIFIADYIEPNRKQLPEMDNIRWAAYTDLDYAVALITKNVLNYLTSIGAITDSLTRETYDYYKSLCEVEMKGVFMDQSKEMVTLAYKALEEKKAEDIQVIEIKDISIIADYFIIANGTNAPQVDALVSSVQDELSKKGFEPKRIEGIRSASWILMDYGDVIVHIFSKEDRLFYNLERIWRDGKAISKEQLGL